MFCQIPENDTLLQTARETIDRASMLRGGAHVLVGVSGGKDSVALFGVLTALVDVFKLRLGIAHYHHGLRGAVADRDARLVEDLAFDAGIPFFYAQGDVHAYLKDHALSTEEAARNLRYAFLESVARRYGFTHIAVGHHADDNAELVLMRLLRGSGRLGLAGIPPVRTCGSGGLTLIRPLIASQRTAIERFCRRYGLMTREDESNRDLRFTRNHIRHKLLPRLKADYNPNLVAGLNRLSFLMRDEEQWIDRLVADHLHAATATDGPQGIALAVNVMERFHPALQRRVLRAALRHLRGDLRRIGFEAVETIRQRLHAANGRGGIDLPGNLRVERYGRLLHIGPPDAMIPVVSFDYTVPETGLVQINETGFRLCLKQIDCPDEDTWRHAGQHVAYFDMSKIVFPITIRSFRPGDRFAPFGLKGRQKLKKYFIDHKIPRTQRSKYPLVVSGGEIIWVAGLRRSDQALVDAHSTKVLRIELLVA
jgi:tRNA(Ile)-lysidine synthase